MLSSVWSQLAKIFADDSLVKATQAVTFAQGAAITHALHNGSISCNGGHMLQLVAVGSSKKSRPARQQLAGSSTNSVQGKQLLHSDTNITMWELVSSPPVCDSRHRSGTLLATRDRIPPSTLLASLLEHPIWKRLDAHEGTAYDRDCRIADTHRDLSLVALCLPHPLSR